MLTFVFDGFNVATGSVVKPAIEQGQELMGLHRRLHDGIAKTVINEHIFVQDGVEVVIGLVSRYLPVPFLEYVHEKSELVVVLVKPMSVKLLQFESRI